MIRCSRPIEPAGFDSDVRQRGCAWLREHPGEELPNYWTEYTTHIAEGSRHLCAYGAIRADDGQIDHFLSKKNRPELAYEWTNYRYALSRVNARKKPVHDGRLLDPYEVGEGWFEVLLPSLLLRLVLERIPEKLWERARFTVDKLRLADDPVLIAMRQRYLSAWLGGEVSLTYVSCHAPLIAAAIEGRIQRLLEHKSDDDGARRLLQVLRQGAITLSGLQDRDPALATSIRKDLRTPAIRYSP